MSFRKTGNGENGRRLRHGFYFAAISMVFFFGLISIIASVPTNNPQLDKKVAERAELRAQHQKAMNNVNAAKDKKSTDAAMKDLEAIEAKLNKVDKEIDTMTGKSESCFPAEMQVVTAEGPRSIRDLQVGDRVLTVDDEGRQGYNPVLKTLRDRNNHYYLINGKIKVTALHRFATAAGWKKARELQVGDRIKTSEDSFEVVVTNELVPADLKVYNLTVADNHNFFVAPDGRQGYLVHNTGGGGGK